MRNKLTKILVLFLLVMTVGCSSFACTPSEKPNEGGTGHTHEYSYKTDTKKHWEECECGEKGEEETHEYNGNKCVCGKYEPTYYTEGLIFELIDDEYVVTDYIGAGEVVIPSTYQGKKVTKIASVNFAPLTSVIIGDNVKIIGDSAFEDCASLSSVEIGESVTTIGQNAFYKCTSLKNIEIPKSVKNIGEGAFSYCVLFTSVVIPDNVTSVGASAFSYCNNLQSVTIGSGVINISDSLFDNCRKLTDVVIPDNVKTIGNSAFNECHALTSMVISDSIISIGSQAFNMCKSLESIEIGANVTSLGSLAFFSCSKLTSLVIPASVTSIGYYLVRDCSELKSITFEDATGWYITREHSEWQKREGGKEAVITNPTDNAKYFEDNFYFYWYKK